MSFHSPSNAPNRNFGTNACLLCILERCVDVKFLTEVGEGLVGRFHFTFQIDELLADLGKIDWIFFLEGIDISGNIEVVVVLFHLTEWGDIAEFINRLTLLVGIDNPLNVLFTHLILIPHFLEVIRGIDEQNVIGVLAGFLQHQDAGRNTCAEEDVGR